MSHSRPIRSAEEKGSMMNRIRRIFEMCRAVEGVLLVAAALLLRAPVAEAQPQHGGRIGKSCRSLKRCVGPCAVSLVPCASPAGCPGFPANPNDRCNLGGPCNVDGDCTTSGASFCVGG